MSRATVCRYSKVAITLHWVTALAIIAMIPMGLWMARAITDPAHQHLAYRLFQLHKSFGLTILALSIFRFAWRLAHAVPRLPEETPAWERFAAHATHAAFYALLVLIPVTGWIYVSSGWSVNDDAPLNVATSWFGLLHVPHLSFVTDMGDAARRITAYRAINVHSVLAWGMIALITMHIGAALKHQYVDRDHIVAGMVPWLKSGEPGQSTTRGVPRAHGLPLIAGVVAIVVLAIAAGLAVRVRPHSGAFASASAAAPATRPVSDERVVPGTASAWTIDSHKSAITFAGVHAGNPFHGQFAAWHGSIWFDPDNLGGSKAAIFVETSSARTGDATQEGSLAEKEWFDPAMFPTARFDTTAFRALGGDRYEATGTLKVKQRVVPVTLPFTLAITRGHATMTGKIKLDRTALDLGNVSDPLAQWVSQAIEVELAVEANRRQDPPGGPGGSADAARPIGSSDPGDPT